MPEHAEKLERWSERVDAEQYEELLNRYERVLLYAGQLQEQTRRTKLLEARADSLRKENERLKKTTDVDEAYIRFLERALESLGILKSEAPSDEAKEE